MNNICQKLVIILVGAISAFVLYQATNDLTVIAQKDNDNDISISLETPVMYSPIVQPVR